MTVELVGELSQLATVLGQTAAGRQVAASQPTGRSCERPDPAEHQQIAADPGYRQRDPADEHGDGPSGRLARRIQRGPQFGQRVSAADEMRHTAILLRARRNRVA